MADIRAVSENTEQELAAGRAADRARAAITELAAGLMRVMAGAGRAYELPRHAGDFLGATDEYHAAVGHGLKVDELRAWLAEALTPEFDTLDREEREIVRASLRLAAARLLGQKTHERTSETALFNALHDRDERKRR